MILAAAKVEGFLDDDGNPTAAALRIDDTGGGKLAATGDAKDAQGSAVVKESATARGDEEGKDSCA